MKRIFAFTLLFQLVLLTAQAQSRGTGTDNGHDWVDLGLSVMWATCNVGANSSEDYGGYYAWGETRTKSNYTYRNCFDCLDDNGDRWSVYKIGGRTMIEPNSGHDTARENWGGTWRMPTEKEFKELENKCIWEWTSKGGHNGYVVTGPNGNSIFLPVAGYRYGTRSSYVGEVGQYWSSMLSSFNSFKAQFLHLDMNYEHFTFNDHRYMGRSVRPVHPKPNTSNSSTINKPVASVIQNKVNGHEWVDLGLSVKWATCNVGASKPEDYGSYYAWGETRTKTSYTWDNCFDCLDIVGTSWRVYKINGKTKLEPNSGHDTARENWGGAWRMPTEAELKELNDRCTWKWTSRGGHNGYVVIGPNGNSIFLPAAGSRNATSYDGVGEYGFYWSSILCSTHSDYAQRQYFNNRSHYTDGIFRRFGFSIRPVTE